MQQQRRIHIMEICKEREVHLMRGEQGLDTKEINTRTWLWGICGLFCLISSIYFFRSGELVSMLVCMGTVFLITLPCFAEKLFGFEMRRSFFVFCLLYAMGPMLGKAFKLYYVTNWWDKLLHTSGGFVFAALGSSFAFRLNGKKDTSLALRAVFGLCFSIALSAVWELFEYGVDCFFAADMQHDTVITAINSHYLSDTAGGLHSIQSIREVTLNGVPLEVGGYLDIGLIDTMLDILVETCGALLYFVWHMIDKDRHPLTQ